MALYRNATLTWGLTLGLTLGLCVLAGSVLAQSDSSQLKESMPNTKPGHPGAANSDNPSATSETKPGAGLVEGVKPGANGSTDISADDRTFVEQATRFATAQVAAGRLALARSHNSGVKEYARKAVDNGENMVSQLKKLSQTLNIGITDSGAKASEETTQLKAAKGKVFDGLYGQLALNDGKAALDLYLQESDHGENGQIKAYAGSMKQHVSTMMHQAETVANSTIDRTNPNCPPGGPAKAGCP